MKGWINTVINYVSANHAFTVNDWMKAEVYRVTSKIQANYM